MKVLGKAGSNKKFRFGGDILARFDFGGQVGDNSFPSVSPVQQKKFEADFAQQFKKVLSQLSKYRWLSPQAVLPPRIVSGPCQPPTDFHVFVSDSYDLSRSLVPAWQGQRGWMEFPAHRVVVGEATIAHELVHVLFPNGNRMLAEGLAVYLQHKLLPRLPVYPNYGDTLEGVIGAFLATNFQGNPSEALWQMDLRGLERISTPDDLFMRIESRPFIGGDPANPNSPPTPPETKFVYAVAGSLVAFLLENPIEYDGILTVNNFGALYASTPLRPLERDSGDPDRWQKFYRGKDNQREAVSFSFTDIVLLWKTYVHVILFAEKPIPANYRKVKLVANLYEELTGDAAKRPANPTAAAQANKAQKK